MTLFVPEGEQNFVAEFEAGDGVLAPLPTYSATYTVSVI